MKLILSRNSSDTFANGVELLSPNVAKNGVAAQVSNHHHTTRFSDPDGAMYAIDGDFSTDVLHNASRCAITLQESGAWWQVGLLTKYRIIKVAITTRRDSGI